MDRKNIKELHSKCRKFIDKISEHEIDGIAISYATFRRCIRGDYASKIKKPKKRRKRINVSTKK